jgi:hypothetical protein
VSKGSPSCKTSPCEQTRPSLSKTQQNKNQEENLPFQGPAELLLLVLLLERPLLLLLLLLGQAGGR